MRLTKGCPLLPVTNLRGAVDFYCAALGFSELKCVADFASVERDGVEVHFWPCSDRNVIENSGANFRVEGVDALQASFAGVSDRGGRVSAPEDQPWSREFHVWDPDGNVLRFSEGPGTA